MNTIYIGVGFHAQQQTICYFVLSTRSFKAPWVVGVQSIWIQTEISKVIASVVGGL